MFSVLIRRSYLQETFIRYLSTFLLSHIVLEKTLLIWRSQLLENACYSNYLLPFSWKMRTQVFGCILFFNFLIEMKKKRKVTPEIWNKFPLNVKKLTILWISISIKGAPPWFQFFPKMRLIKLIKIRFCAKIYFQKAFSFSVMAS